MSRRGIYNSPNSKKGKGLTILSPSQEIGRKKKGQKTHAQNMSIFVGKNVFFELGEIY